jgi:hypothetical protein
MRQVDMFGEESETKKESTYTTTINLPVYEPRGKTPYIIELVDTSKTNRLVNEINNSNLTEEEKTFLIISARRHTVFHYEKIADYYASASPEMQQFMERSALVIIDFDKAYTFGYINLANDIANEYFKQYGAK